MPAEQRCQLLASIRGPQLIPSFAEATKAGGLRRGFEKAAGAAGSSRGAGSREALRWSGRCPQPRDIGQLLEEALSSSEGQAFQS